MLTDLSRLTVSPGDSIHDAIARIDRNSAGIVLVLDAGGRLAGTVTDGDIRRALLAGADLKRPVGELLTAKSAASPRHPVTASAEAGHESWLQIMKEHVVRQLPLTDAEGRISGLVTMDELLPDHLPIQAVIMAGGYGKRLRPLTEDLPKPMLPVGDRPLMEHLVDQLRDAGIRRVHVATHYRAEKITEHFGDGSEFGVELTYVAEDQPMGTAGALSRLDRPAGPLLVVNGDILTRVDFRAMLAFHREHRADMTVAVRKYDVNVPYGVIECSGVCVTGIAEKPLYSFLVNAGIYLIEPSVHACIPAERRFDMTDLIHVLLRQQRAVVSFPILEYWLDVGQPLDYQRAQEDIKKLEGLR